MAERKTLRTEHCVPPLNSASSKDESFDRIVFLNNELVTNELVTNELGRDLQLQFADT